MHNTRIDLKFSCFALLIKNFSFSIFSFLQLTHCDVLLGIARPTSDNYELLNFLKVKIKVSNIIMCQLALVKHLAGDLP